MTHGEPPPAPPDAGATVDSVGKSSPELDETSTEAAADRAQDAADASSAANAAGDAAQSTDALAASDEAQAAQPAADQPAPIPGRNEELAVDPRSVNVSRIVGLVALLPVAIVPPVFLTLGRVLGDMPGGLYLGFLGAWLVVLSGLLLFAIRWPAIRYRHLRYRVDHDGLHIKRGVIWRSMISIPITRVQHTDVSQGPIQRRFHLATLTVHTAGTAGASISLSGLGHGIASELSDHLRPQPQ